MANKRHKYRDGEPTATFDGLNKKERAQSINMQRLNLKRAEAAHERINQEEEDEYGYLESE